MITILIENCNNISQDFYDQITNDIRIFSIQCTCGKKGCLIRYGHYKRSLKFRLARISLSIQRLFCKNCHKTHALLLSQIVPYSQIPLNDQQEILKNVCNGEFPDAVMERNLLIDENNMKYIVHQYHKHWEQRLLSIGKSLQDNLTIPCPHTFLRQFMQIYKVRNLLYSSNNIT